MSMFIISCVMVFLFELSSQVNFTWREAYDKCKQDNSYLESDVTAKEVGPSKRFGMSQSSVWIGNVELFSKWLEIRGCYIIDDTTSGNVNNAQTIANCEMECQQFDFFAYKTGDLFFCKCLSKLPNNTTDANNCAKDTYSYLTVYGRYKSSELYENRQENCMFMSCSPGQPNIINGPHVSNCMSNAAHFVCANNVSLPLWNLGWNRSLQYCIKTYGIYFLDDFKAGCALVRANSWTRFFRQQSSFYYDVHYKDEIKNHQLVKCASKRWNVANDLWMKEYIDCNTRLPYYFCNKGSQYSKTTAKVGFSSAVTEENEKTTVNRRYSSYGGLVRSTILSAWTSQAMKQSNGITNSVMTTSGPTKNTSSSIHNIGRSSTRNENRSDVIIGTVVGGLTVIVGVSILLLICKIRSLGIFSKKTDHSIAEFSKESGERSDQSIPKKKQQIVENKRSGLEIQKTKDIYAEVKKTKKTENIKTLYSEVNKIRTLSSDIRKTDDNYIELPEGEYDRLNNFDIRLLEKDSNMYDSNVGIRNVQDPMYDTTLHASRLESEDVYDHSFPNVNTDSNYDCSSSLAHTNIKENDVDKSV